MTTVTGVRQPLARGDAAGDYTVTRSPAVRSCPLGEGCPYCLDNEVPWPALPLNAWPGATRSTRAGTAPAGRTARSSGAACGARATRPTGPKGRPGRPSPGSEPVRLLLSAPVLSHRHIHVAGVILAVIVTTVTAALLASASPPGPARAATASASGRPGLVVRPPATSACKQRSATGRVPRPGAVTIHRTAQAIRREKSRHPGQWQKQRR